MSSTYADLDHISAVEAARQFGYTNDYIARLARERRVAGKRVGREWYVDIKSLEAFISESQESKKLFRERLRIERQQERANTTRPVSVQKAAATPSPALAVTPMRAPRAAVLAKAGMVLCASVLIGGAFYTTGTEVARARSQQAGVFDVLREVATKFYTMGNGSVTESKTTSTQGVSGEGVVQGDAKQDGGVREGMVVVPPSDKRTDEEIARSFSDEVRIERDAHGIGGVITPVFTHSSGTGYRYLMVPLEAVRSP